MKEMQYMKMKCYFTPIRLAVYKKKDKMTNTSKVEEKLETSSTDSERVKWLGHFGRQSGSSTKS